jgi:hypothetical protein
MTNTADRPIRLLVTVVRADRLAAVACYNSSSSVLSHEVSFLRLCK